MKKKHLYALAAFFILISVFLILFEGACYLIYKNRYSGDERNLAYVHDELLGWFPERSSTKYFGSLDKIQIQHNSRGYRDDEYRQKPISSMVFLGDSFVWGFDVKKEDRFTEKLRATLPDSEIYNVAVSGYSTDQQLLLLRRDIDYFDPEIVFLMFCGNDRLGNSSNMGYGYYKPYFRQVGSNLQLCGVPVPKNAMYRFKTWKFMYKPYAIFMLLKLMEKIHKLDEFQVPDPTERIIYEINHLVKSRGAKLVVGLIDKDVNLKKYCEHNSIDVLDLDMDMKYRFTYGGSHWTPTGHSLISDKIMSYIDQILPTEQLQ